MEDSLQQQRPTRKLKAIRLRLPRCRQLPSAQTRLRSSQAFEAAPPQMLWDYGRAKETAYQLGKALKEIKRDVERAFVGVDNAAVTGNASTAREMASVTQQIASGNSIDAGSGSTDPLTEAKILECHQAVFEAGGDPTVLMVKPADATIVSGFTAASGRQRTFNDDTTTLTATVDFLVNSFGTLNVQINRHQLSTHAFLLIRRCGAPASSVRSPDASGEDQRRRPPLHCGRTNPEAHELRQTAWSPASRKSRPTNSGRDQHGFRSPYRARPTAYPPRRQL